MSGAALLPPGAGVRRAAVYARVSICTQALLHSVNAQIEAYTRLVQTSPGWQLAGVYADIGVSGTSVRARPEFQRMMADCEAGKIDVVLVKSVSRFARNTVDLLVSVRRLSALGVSVWFEEQNIHSLTQEGELLLTLISSIAQAESVSISENMKWAIRKGFARGMENTRRRTLGYRWQGERLIVIPGEAQIIRRIFAGFLAGESRAATARALADAGMRSAKGGMIGTSSIGYILRNITYTGALLLQKTYTQDPFTKSRRQNRGQLPQYLVEGHHAAIISQSDFARVQELLQKNEQEKRFPYNRTGQKYCFTGLIRCGCCGRHYTRQLWKNGTAERPTWVCTGKKCIKNRCTKSKNFSESYLLNTYVFAMRCTLTDDEQFMHDIEEIVALEDRTLMFVKKSGKKVEVKYEKARKTGVYSALTEQKSCL